MLDDTLLHYYYAANDPSPAKSIYLHGTTIKDEGERMVEGRNMRGIQVSHRATSKVYNLAAEDTEVREESRGEARRGEEREGGREGGREEKRREKLEASENKPRNQTTEGGCMGD